MYQIGETLALERERELEAIDGALHSALEGDGVLIAVEGSAGIGKSLILDLGRRQAADRGFLTLAARGGELEHDFAFGVVRRLFERYLLELPAAVRERVLSGAAGLSAPAVGDPAAVRAAPVDASFSVIHGLYWLAANLACEQPLLLSVDDVHWVDSPSLRFLLYLAVRLEGLQLVVLVAARPREPGADAELAGRLMGSPSAIALRPAPLSREATGTLIEARFGSAGAPAFAAVCHRSSAGNPFVLEELLRALQADGVDPSTARTEQVERLGPGTIARLLLSALHGRAMARGADPEPLAEAVAVLAASPARLDHASALVDLGASLRRSNQRVRAREPLRQGLELARRLGATVLARRAHDELVRAGARPRRLMFSGVESLTPSERLVTELAASGQANREIAQTLFVTPKTVENHLGRAYIKLGVKGRHELGTVLQLELSHDPPR